MVSEMKDDKLIILFDGFCNLCNGSVNLVIDRDINDRFQFASLQSSSAKLLLQEFGEYQGSLDSVILIKNNRLYHKSDAALMIAQKLGGLWPLASIFFIVPKFIRDWVYGIIAKNRYKWFGKLETCRIPTPELRAKFLEDVNVSQG
jgi:predicted DCC family thiol-disulfide oxidoreductase YuxK